MKDLRFVVHEMLFPTQQNSRHIDHQEIFLILDLDESMSGIEPKQFYVLKGW